MIRGVGSTGRAAWLAGLSAILFAGCFSSPTKTDLMKRAENLQDVSTVELRARCYGFVRQFSVIVEEAADQIIADSDDSNVRLAALRWKMNMIPAAHAAAFRPDPLIGLIDVGALCAQQERFFTDGAGRALFGEWQPAAERAVTRITRDFWKLADSVTRTGDTSVIRREIDEWAEENPFDDEYFFRASIEPLITSLAATQVGARGVGATLGGVTDTVSDLSERLTIYGAWVPKQSRWQAELLAREMLAELEVEELSRTTARLTDSVERAVDTFEQTPDVIARERGAATDALAETVGAVMDDVDRQRLQSIESLVGEREIVLAALVAEREAILAAVREERVKTVTDMDALLERHLQLGFDRAERLVDGIFVRLAALVVLAGVGFLVTGVVVARIVRPRPTPR